MLFSYMPCSHKKQIVDISRIKEYNWFKSLKGGISKCLMFMPGGARNIPL